MKAIHLRPRPEPIREDLYRLIGPPYSTSTDEHCAKYNASNARLQVQDLVFFGPVLEEVDLRITIGNSRTLRIDEKTERIGGRDFENSDPS